MCGIAGIAFRNGPAEFAGIEVRRMIELQHHRGPDGTGFYEGNGIVLGHCRLAVQDLTEAGRQPMSDPQGRFEIVFNGEIYNWIELRKQLESLGHRFRTRCDTEVLLAAFIQWGEASVLRLRGMFAFAVWDKCERRLFAARDRLGIKPFHFFEDDEGRFLFASELKALLPFQAEREANVPLAHAYLALNLLDHVPAETMCAGIHRLPAAHTLTWSERHGLSQRCYWKIEFNDALETPKQDLQPTIAEFRRQFAESIALHLRSDAPVGTALSGGLDSSAVVCAIHEELKRRNQSDGNLQHVFSACFDIPSLDERPYIEDVVRATQCSPHYVFPSGERLNSDLHQWLWHQEEPVGGTGTYAHYCVARLAKECGIKVLLDGQGADELLGGYRKFILVYLRQLIRESRFQQALFEATAFFSSLDVLRTCDFSEGRRYLFKDLGEIDVLFPQGVEHLRPREMGITDSLGKRLKADLLHFSLPVLLRYEDRNTAAFGIESRVPFVDHVLVESLAGIATDLRLNHGWTKRILREGLADILPRHVALRKTKLGFSTPEGKWLAGPLFEWIRETLACPAHLGAIVDPARVRTLLNKSLSGNHSKSLMKVLFRLAVYETWAQLFLASPKHKNVRDRVPA